MPLFRPELFQGARKRRRYFEGWYFKQVSPEGRAWSFIPGVSMDLEGRRHAFVQAIDGSAGTTRWYEFPFEAFRWNPRALDLRVGNNRFSLSGLELDLDGPDGRLSALLRFEGITPFPGRPWRPGIMGPYSFVPFMECSHGLVSLDHLVGGWVDAGGGRVPLEGGRGYIEKDWGSSMPSAWIWCQSNSFPEPGVSLMFSLANIPWMGGRFPGFLCAARFPGSPSEGGTPRDGMGNMRVWATWNGARIISLEAGDRSISVSMTRRGERIDLVMERGRGGLLRAPTAGAMARRIAESVDAVLNVRLSGPAGLAYEGEARPAGLETVGDLSVLGVG